MARKHNLKRHRVSQPVERITVETTDKKDRKVVLNPVTDQYEVQTPSPVVKQGRALGPTIQRKPKTGRRK